MFWKPRNQFPANNALCAKLLPTASIAPYLVAARADTNHTTGPGQVAITGRYDSKNDSFGVDAAYALDDNQTLYASYTVTDEKVSFLGLETNVPLPGGGPPALLDLTYCPPSDTATAKVSVRRNNLKLTAASTVTTPRTTRLESHDEQFELDATLSAFESLRLSFDASSKAASVKLSRKLDPKNKLDATYSYNTASSKYVSLKFSHLYSKVHTFSANINYGAKKYAVQWDCNTDNGPWTISTSFPFNASPHSGEWNIKRRFEF